jgi:hypothetical protein
MLRHLKRCWLSNARIHIDNEAFIKPIDQWTYNLTEDEQLSNLAQGLFKAKSTPIGGGIQALKLPSGIEIPNLNRGAYSPDTLFIRSIYDDLFKNIRSRDDSILLGNPGTCKSM